MARKGEILSNPLPRVVLRAPDESDVDFLALLDTPEVAGAFDSFDDPLEEMLSFHNYAGGKRVVELADATRVGVVSWIQIPYGPNVRSLAWSIGITIHPAYRRRHFGAAAQRQLARALFDLSEANRVQADTDVANIAEQRSLELAGFTREGVARQAQWRQGSWHDRIVYGLLREEAFVE